MATSSKHSHSDLCHIAKRWLLRSSSANGAHCKIAYTEVGALYNNEKADAWGYNFDYNFTVVVEAKVSRSDFLSDHKKPHRNGQVDGMGDFRYYICPENLIMPEDLPPKWGLLWVNRRGHVKVIAGHVLSGNVLGRASKDSEIFSRWGHSVNLVAEQRMMGHLMSSFGDIEKSKESIRELRRQLNNAERKIQELKSIRRPQYDQILKGLESLSD